MFGSFEQLKSILIAKNKKSEELFLKGADHNRIQAFWIPCSKYQFDPTQTATVIFCG